MDTDKLEKQLLLWALAFLVIILFVSLVADTIARWTQLCGVPVFLGPPIPVLIPAPPPWVVM